MKNTEKSVRRFLYDQKFWIGVAYVGLSLVVVGLFYVNSRTSESLAHNARDEAIHQSEIIANSRAALEACLNSRPTLTSANKMVTGLVILDQVIIENSRNIVKTTPADDMQYQTRLRNYKRIKSTISLISSLHFIVPTIKQCKLRGKAARKG